MMNIHKLATFALLISAGTALAQAPNALVVDRRPANEDRQRNLSVSVFSCSFGIRVLSDEGRSRRRLDALDAALRASPATAFSSKAKKNFAEGEAGMELTARSSKRMPAS